MSLAAVITGGGGGGWDVCVTTGLRINNVHVLLSRSSIDTHYWYEPDSACASVVPCTLEGPDWLVLLLPP